MSYQWNVSLGVQDNVAGPTQLCVANPRRRAIFFSNIIATNRTINPNSDFTEFMGFPLQSGFPPLTFLYRDWGDMVCADWWFWGYADGSILYFTELLYIPDNINQR